MDDEPEVSGHEARAAAAMLGTTLRMLVARGTLTADDVMEIADQTLQDLPGSAPERALRLVQFAAIVATRP